MTTLTLCRIVSTTTESLKQRKKPMRKEKIERNREMFQRKKEGWTYGQLKEHYSLARPTIWEIVKRLEKAEKEELDKKA